MNRFRGLLARVAEAFGRNGRDADLAAELESHLQFHIDDNIRRGMSAEEARRQALIQLGGLDHTKEIYRDRRGLPWLDSFLQDLHFGMRMLCKNPGFTATAILTLALGIGANAAIFTILNSVLLSHLPVRDPQQLVFLTNPGEHGGEIGFSDGERDLVTYAEFRELERNNQVFSGMLAASSYTAKVPVNVESPDSGVYSAVDRVSLVSGSYFSVLGVSPVLGRAFTKEVDDSRDANPVAVIAYNFWRDRFGGERNVLGSKIRILNTSYTVIGVAPPQFHGETVGVDPAVWVPLSMQGEVLPGADYLSPETNHFHKTEWIQVIGRLKPGVTLAQAKAAVAAAFAQVVQSQAAGMSAEDKLQFLNQYLPVTEGSRGASMFRDSFGKPLQILMAVVGLVLLIACANVANILLARSAVRQKEISVRVALGAGASRLFRQVLTESVLLAAIGGAFGLLLAHWADLALLRMVSGGGAQIPLDVHLDAKILGFTAVVSLLTGILFGLVPAFRVTDLDLNSVLKGASHNVAGVGTGGRRMSVGKILVVAQVALSVLLLVVAALFVQSFRNLAHVQLGYDGDHLLQFHINALPYGYQRPEILALYKDMLQRIGAIPGVRGATLADNGLLGGTDSSDTVSVEGQNPKAGDDSEARWDLVGPNFFSTAGIPILIGREITSLDSGDGERVGIVNQSFARKYFANSNPIGQRILVHETEGHFDFVIVGVAADSKHGSVREKPSPRFYVPFFNPVGIQWVTRATFIIRTSGDPSAVTSAVRSSAKQTAANLPPVDIQTLKQRLFQTLVSDRMITQLAGAFGALATILVCIGLYGIMSYAVSGRVNEIGIRAALGARRSDILWMILRESLVLVLVGIAIGLPATYGAGKWISSLLFGVTSADPAAITLATGLIFVVALFACCIPACRAMRVDPMIALRHE